MLDVIPSESLAEFLNSTVVSGSRKNFRLKDLVMIDGSVMFVC